MDNEAPLTTTSGSVIAAVACLLGLGVCVGGSAAVLATKSKSGRLRRVRGSSSKEPRSPRPRDSDERSTTWTLRSGGGETQVVRIETETSLDESCASEDVIWIEELVSISKLSRARTDALETSRTTG